MKCGLVVFLQSYVLFLKLYTMYRVFLLLWVLFAHVDAIKNAEAREREKEWNPGEPKFYVRAQVFGPPTPPTAHVLIHVKNSSLYSELFVPAAETYVPDVATKTENVSHVGDGMTPPMAYDVLQVFHGPSGK